MLKWAFEGKLGSGFSGLKDDRMKEGRSEKKILQSSNPENPASDKGELPEGWKWITLGEVASKIQIGPFGSQLHKEDYIQEGIPLINPMHIQNDKIVPDYSYSISKEKKDSLPNYILNTGDIILGRRGEMGRCGLVREKENGWFCGTGSLYVRPNPDILNSKFLFGILGSGATRKYLEDHATGTTMANLNKKIVQNIPLLLPSTLNEQNEIVAEIESRLSVCDKIEETISQSLQQAEALRQSILKKAFEGTLVPQDPNDEPASVLLERIRAERQVQGKIKPVKTKKVKKAKVERVPEVGEQLTLL